MDRSHCNGLFIIIGVTLALWIIGTDGMFPSYGGINEKCNISKNEGLYRRSFFTCCKEKLLEPNSKMTFLFSSQECRINETRDNPDDDLATSMWKIEACRLKSAMAKPEESINFESFVEFMTQNYTSQNNIKNIIRDANKECKDAEKETEFHKRIAAFYICFYKNEQETCDTPTAKGLEYKELQISYMRNLTINPRKTCDPASTPGAWEGEFYCCNGKPTPQQWKSSWTFAYFFSTDEAERNKSRDCSFQKPVSNVFNAQMINLSKHEEGNITNEERAKYKRLFMFTCNDACNLNPVIFQNDSSGPEIKFDANEVLDKLYSKYTESVRKELKEIALRQLKDFKVGVTMDEIKGGQEFSMDEIASQYQSAKDQALKIQYYCAYYRHIKAISDLSPMEYCISEDSLKHSLQFMKKNF